RRRCTPSSVDRRRILPRRSAPPAPLPVVGPNDQERTLIAAPHKQQNPRLWIKFGNQVIELFGIRNLGVVDRQDQVAGPYANPRRGAVDRFDLYRAAHAHLLEFVRRHIGHDQAEGVRLLGAARRFAATPMRPRMTRPDVRSCSWTFIASSIGIANEIPA